MKTKKKEKVEDAIKKKTKQKKNTKWRKRRKREMENEGEEVEETLVIEYKDRDNCIYVCFAGVSYATIHEMIYMISDAYRITGVCWNIFSSVTESLCCLETHLWRIR